MLENVHIDTHTSTYGITTAEAKEQLNLLDTSFDTLIDGYISSAHVMLYQEANLLLDGKLIGHLRDFCDFDIPYGPISSIAIYYYDTNNTRTLLNSSNYIFTKGKIALVEVVGSEPSVYDRDFPYEVEITTSTNTNPMVKQCLRMIVSDFFENRQSNVVGASVNRVVSRATNYQISLVSLRDTI